MKTWTQVVVLFAAILPLGQCSGRHAEPPVPRAVHSWLTCIDCTTGDLNSVLAIRPHDAAVAVLSLALLSGPGVVERSRLARAWRRMNARDRAFAAQHGSVQFATAAEFVNENLMRFDRTWRIRAAMALGQINTPHARAALSLAVSTLADTLVVNIARQAADSAFQREVRAGLQGR